MVGDLNRLLMFRENGDIGEADQFKQLDMRSGCQRRVLAVSWTAILPLVILYTQPFFY